MPFSTISGIKVISTCGLGLLAGFSIASPSIVTPTISSLSTKFTAATLSRRQKSVGWGVGVAGTIISLCLGGTFWGSSSYGGRHPYLLYAGFLSLGAAVVSGTVVARQVDRITAVTEGDVNGERVSVAFERLQQYETLVATLFSLAFGVAVVGNYGDFK